MCDENAANQLAIEKVYGKEFLTRVVTCQWHFKQYALRQVPEVHVMERETSRSMSTRYITVTQLQITRELAQP